MLDSFIGQYREYLPDLDPDQIAALESHLALLQHWNRTINLTAVKSQSEAIRKHLGESLFLAAHLPSGPLWICDLGSGGGFPGVPVAVARPDCHVTLVESDVRKGVFLREAGRKLSNISVATQRFETIQGKFHWLISRAVNLSKTVGGPECAVAAFLGTVEVAAKPSVAGTYCWRTVSIPWETGSFLSIGERFT